MRKLKLGVIGCGDITKYTLAMAKLNRRIQIVGCTDTQIDRARKYASFFKKAQAFTDYKDMIHAVELDAVYLAVPHHLHYPIMKDLINQGIHVLCEKPITTKIEHANEILELSKANRVKVGVNYQYRYDKACYRLVMAARNGDLGQLYYGICNIPWHRSDAYFEQSKWHSKISSSGGGTLLTQGSHALDILLWAFNDKPARISGAVRNYKFKDVEVEDTATGFIELANGSTITITSSMAAAEEEPVSISLYGSKGTAHYTGSFFSRVKFAGVKVPRYKLNARGVHALGCSLDAFTKWVLYDAPYHNSAEDAIPVLECVLNLYQSAQK